MPSVRQHRRASDTVPVVATATPSLVKNARGMRSTIALKLMMAVSGIIFIGFVLLHMYGNLKAFAGHDAYNDYAHHLRTFGEPMLPYGGLLWVIRVVLILSLVLLSVSGMADSVSVVIRSTLLQLLTPAEMLGRVTAVNAVFVSRMRCFS